MDRLLACRLQPDSDGRTSVEDRGEQYLYNSISATAEASQADTCQEQKLVPLCKTLICSGGYKEVQGVDQLQWHAMILSSAGSVEQPVFSVHLCCSHICVAAVTSFTMCAMALCQAAFQESSAHDLHCLTELWDALSDHQTNTTTVE